MFWACDLRVVFWCGGLALWGVVCRNCGAMLVIDKTFLIAEPMGKVSWTKCFAAGGGSVGGGLE